MAVSRYRETGHEKSENQTPSNRRGSKCCKGDLCSTFEPDNGVDCRYHRALLPKDHQNRENAQKRTESLPHCTLVGFHSDDFLVLFLTRFANSYFSEIFHSRFSRSWSPLPSTDSAILLKILLMCFYYFEVLAVECKSCSLKRLVEYFMQ